MHYNVDLRQKVIAAVKRGHSKAEVARMFGINRQSIYNWMARADLVPSLATTRLRKVDPTKLKALVAAHPDLRLIDYAARMGIGRNTVHYQFKKLGITKKNDPIRGTEVYTADTVSSKSEA